MYLSKIEVEKSGKTVSIFTPQRDQFQNRPSRYCPLSTFLRHSVQKRLNLQNHSINDMSILGLLYASTESTQKTHWKNGSVLNLEVCILQDSKKQFTYLQ